MKINRYLGFTDRIKEPQKTKVENTLHKRYSYKGGIYNAVELLCIKLLEGWKPEKIDNYQRYKRNGELTNPKTLYRCVDTDHKFCLTLNKTEYDFMCYLIEKGFNAEDDILTYDQANIEAIKRAEEAEKEQQEEEKRKAAEEKERLNLLIAEGIQHISDEEKEIANNIFILMYGKECPNYSLIALIHNFDVEYCKTEIIARLHNENKASIKIFECLTGLKLPKTYKGRKAYIESITKADFRGMTEYKPRKKAGHMETPKEEFYISVKKPEGLRWEKVFAEPFKKYGVEMCFICTNGYFNLSHAESGVSIMYGKSKAECIDKLKAYVNTNGKENFIKLVNDRTSNIYKAIGVNPRYKEEGITV